MNNQSLIKSVSDWLYTQAETEIQDHLVDMMLSIISESLSNIQFPDLSQFPPQVREQFKNQLVSQVKDQTLVSLRALIRANREDSGRLNELIVQKHFGAEDVREGLVHVEKYSEAYGLEVEELYNKINASDFTEVVMFN